MSVIEVEELRKEYDGRAVVDGVTFSVKEGEIFAVLGPNGAGKTTTVETIAGLRRPDGGRVRVLGLDPISDGPQLKELVGVQLQESRFPDKIKVGEALELYGTFYPAPRTIPQLVEELGLSDLTGKTFAKLSGGQRQRLSIAVALVGNPRIAILDELTTGLDPQARRDTWALVEGMRDRGVTIVLVTHFMEEAERLADHVALIDRGRVVALDTPEGIVSRTASGQTMRFRPASPLEDAMLLGLDEVSELRREGEHIVLSGSDDMVHAVTSLLARKQITAHELRVDQATLDDAFVALTGRSFETEEH